MTKALMELGSQVCKPVAPTCSECPLKTQCKAFAEVKHMLLTLREELIGRLLPLLLQLHRPRINVTSALPYRPLQKRPLSLPSLYSQCAKRKRCPGWKTR
jgi:adenine-specific DNA glycosylase